MLFYTDSLALYSLWIGKIILKSILSFVSKISWKQVFCLAVPFRFHIFVDMPTIEHFPTALFSMKERKLYDIANF